MEQTENGISNARILPNRMRRNSHTQVEVDWAKEMIATHGMGQKVIRDNRLLDVYKERFGKDLQVSGMYAWFKYVQDPEYKKKASKNPRSSEKKEQMVFTKSLYIAYINGTLAGFESKEDLVSMMEQNKILTNEIRIFKSIPVDIKYSVILEG